MNKSVHVKTMRALLGIIIFMVVATQAGAQTYTTINDGNWSSASTWQGGIIPDKTIPAGAVVNIKHDVTFDITSDLDILGTLNISNDTLRYMVNSDRNLIVEASGLLSVTNGGILQDQSKKGDFIIKGGKVRFNNAYVEIYGMIQAQDNSKRYFNASSIYCGDNYIAQGSSGKLVTDTVIMTDMYAGTNGKAASADFTFDFVNCYVSYASFFATHNLKVAPNGHMIALPAATYGVDLLKVLNDLTNEGDWQAPVNNYCAGHSVNGTKVADFDFTKAPDCNATVTAATDTASSVPELVFRNPVLVSGTDLKQGAVYKFSSVVSGIDANITLVKFSDPNLVMQSIDVTNTGWDKAFQPQFGYPGWCPAYSNWYVDFKVDFYKAGTNTPLKVQQFYVTALDVDGDGYSVAEYVKLNATAATYSGATYLKPSAPAPVTCPVCGKLSLSVSCPICLGTGLITKGRKNSTCAQCGGSGKVFALCLHPWTGTDILNQATIDNQVGIDTSAITNMVTYQMNNVSSFTFSYGATSQASDNGGGMRLNSMWFKGFNLTAPAVAISLPVHLNKFVAQYAKKDVTLTWSSNEVDFSHYVIQRSTDGKIYTDIAVVMTAEENNQLASYSYVDRNVSSSTGLLIYRLKMVDLSKEVSYSPLRSIRLTATQQDDAVLAAYPNPATDNVRIVLPASCQNRKVTIEIFSSNGTRLQSWQVNNASQTELVNLASLTKGFYLVKASCDAQSAQQRLVKN